MVRKGGRERASHRASERENTKDPFFQSFLCCCFGCFFAFAGAFLLETLCPQPETQILNLQSLNPTRETLGFMVLLHENFKQGMQRKENTNQRNSICWRNKKRTENT